MKKVSFKFRVSVNVRVVRSVCKGVDWVRVVKIVGIIVRLYLLFHASGHHLPKWPALLERGEWAAVSSLKTVQNARYKQPMIKKVAFTMYPVKDISRARNFYETVLGLKFSSSAAEGKWIEYDLPGGGCFAITTMVPELSPSSSQGGSIAFELDNLEETMKRLKTEGVEVKVDVYQSPVCRMAVILDSEGNAVVLHQLNSK